MDLGSRDGELGIYIPIAYPNPETFRRVLGESSQYVDIFELGVPSKKPIYDGPYIRRIHRSLVSSGVDYLSVARSMNRSLDGVDVAVLGYYRDLLGDRYGLFDELASTIDSLRCILIPDLLIEYTDHLENYIDKSSTYGIETCFFISSKFPYRLVSGLAKYRPYFIYLGLQASTGSDLPIHLVRNIGVARKLIGEGVKLAIGFGINKPEKLRKLLASGADIAFIGTEFLRRLSQGIDYALGFIRSMYEALR